MLIHILVNDSRQSKFLSSFIGSLAIRFPCPERVRPTQSPMLKYPRQQLLTGDTRDKTTIALVAGRKYGTRTREHETPRPLLQGKNWSWQCACIDTKKGRTGEDIQYHELKAVYHRKRTAPKLDGYLDHRFLPRMVF